MFSLPHLLDGYPFLPWCLPFSAGAPTFAAHDGAYVAGNPKASLAAAGEPEDLPKSNSDDSLDSDQLHAKYDSYWRVEAAKEKKYQKVMQAARERAMEHSATSSVESTAPAPEGETKTPTKELRKAWALEKAEAEKAEDERREEIMAEQEEALGKAWALKKAEFEKAEAAKRAEAEKREESAASGRDRGGENTRDPQEDTHEVPGDDDSDPADSIPLGYSPTEPEPSAHKTKFDKYYHRFLDSI